MRHIMRQAPIALLALCAAFSLTASLGQMPAAAKSKKATAAETEAAKTESADSTTNAADTADASAKPAADPTMDAAIQPSAVAGDDGASQAKSSTGSKKSTKPESKKAAQPESADQPPATSKKAASGDEDPNRPYKDEAIKHYNKGVEFHQKAALNSAIMEYKAALAADGRLEEAYSNLGLIYCSQKNYSQALDAFKKALALKPARPYTLNGLGTVLYAKGKLQEAMEKWQQAVDIDPRFDSAYVNMGNALEQERDLQGALNQYVKALRANPKMAEAYYRTGLIYCKMKHPAQAFSLLTDALKLAPDAEFASEAKRQIKDIQESFPRDTAGDEPQVRMNVVAPVEGSTAETGSTKMAGGEEN